MFVFGLIVGIAAGITLTLLYQKYVLKLFTKVDKVVSDVKTDLK